MEFCDAVRGNPQRRLDYVSLRISFNAEPQATALVSLEAVACGSALNKGESTNNG